MYWKFADGTNTKAQGTTAIAVGATGYFEACMSGNETKDASYMNLITVAHKLGETCKQGCLLLAM